MKKPRILTPNLSAKERYDLVCELSDYVDDLELDGLLKFQNELKRNKVSRYCKTLERRHRHFNHGRYYLYVQFVGAYNTWTPIFKAQESRRYRLHYLTDLDSPKQMLNTLTAHAIARFKERCFKEDASFVDVAHAMLRSKKVLGDLSLKLNGSVYVFTELGVGIGEDKLVDKIHYERTIKTFINYEMLFGQQRHDFGEHFEKLLVNRFICHRPTYKFLLKKAKSMKLPAEKIEFLKENYDGRTKINRAKDCIKEIRHRLNNAPVIPNYKYIIPSNVGLPHLIPKKGEGSKLKAYV
ncbi:hypothetical protein FUAX_30170 [Fulvitalea axinellae]|uniref:Uncharacterized protein n=1 Tax=Fulvitalea axinellae TaxID=1182444 RepID=A0AAU9DHL4_9BACT|nr:hypothetical protein FUAX_30170 [Fulvitalea axinellae]